MSDQLKSYLRRLGLQSNEIDEISKYYLPRTLTKGEHFLVTGKPSAFFAFINAGIIRMHYWDEKGRDVICHFLSVDHFFPLTALTKEPAVYSFQALSSCELLIINAADLDDLITRLPVLSKIMGQMLREALISKTTPQNNFKAGNSKQRYEQFLMEHKAFASQIPVQYIASYIGITRQSLSRIRRQVAK